MSYYNLIPFHRHSHPNLDFNKKIVVASVDPGLANFANRIEERVPGESPAPLLFEKVSFGGKEATRARKESGENVVRIWGDILDYIDDRAFVFDRVNLYVLEKQLHPNHSVSMVSQHFKSCLMQRYRDRPPYPVMMEISPRLKSLLLRANGEKAKGKELKKICVAVAMRLLEERGDAEGVKILKGSKKKDDLADTVVQLEALFRHLAPGGADFGPR